MKSKQVDFWISIMRQHEQETVGFSADLSAMQPDELQNLKTVNRETLEFAPGMFRLIAPKDHPKLRRAIAYLTDLQHRQQVALGQQIHQWEKEARAFNGKMKSQNFATWE